MTKTCRSTPIWLAARPTPGASYIVANMSLISCSQVVTEFGDLPARRGEHGVADRDDRTHFPCAGSPVGLDAEGASVAVSASPVVDMPLSCQPSRL